MRICRLLRHLPIVFFWFAAGCASLDQPFRELPRLSLPDHPRLYDKIANDEKLVNDFLKCSGETYGLPSTVEPANSSTCAAGDVGERAACVAAHLVRGNLEQMFAKAPQDLRAQVKDLVDLDGRRPTSGPIAGKLRNAVEAVEHKIAPRGYAKLLAAMPQLIEHLHARILDDEERMTQSGSRFERLLVAYNNAYFGDMKFEAAPDAPHMQIKGVVRSVSDGFVDRNGAALAFPGLSADLVVSKQAVQVHGGSADSRRVASDLARIFVEALFDAAFQVPATERATALKIAGYPKFDVDNPPISKGDLAKVATDALRAEAAVTSHIGEVVRGGGGLGIQNETLASVIETAAGVIAKKLTEHELFCYYRATSGKSDVKSVDARDTVSALAW